jgi:hypothetical protein
MNAAEHLKALNVGEEVAQKIIAKPCLLFSIEIEAFDKVVPAPRFRNGFKALTN